MVKKKLQECDYAENAVDEKMVPKKKRCHQKTEHSKSSVVTCADTKAVDNTDAIAFDSVSAELEKGKQKKAENTQVVAGDGSKVPIISHSNGKRAVEVVSTETKTKKKRQKKTEDVAADDGSEVHVQPNSKGADVVAAVSTKTKTKKKKRQEAEDVVVPDSPLDEVVKEKMVDKKVNIVEPLEQEAVVETTKAVKKAPKKKSKNAAKQGEKASVPSHLETIEVATKESREQSGSETVKSLAPGGDNTKCNPTDVAAGYKSTNTASANNFGQWTNAEFDSTDRQQKFFRLLGSMKSKSVQDPDLIKPSSSAAMSRVEQDKLNKSLECQYEEARGMMLNTQKKCGLGFEQPPDAGKKLYIDKTAVRSKNFAD